MKTLKILFLATVIISLTGCKYKKESEQLKISIQSLTVNLAKSDSTLKANLMLVKEFETRIDSILSGGKNPGQMVSGTAMKARLDQTVTEVNNLLKDNKEKYQSARNMISRANSTVLMKDAEIKNLNALIVKNDSIINSLNLEIAGLNKTIDDKSVEISNLTAESRTKGDTLTSMTNRLNIAYYISGTTEDLKSKNVIIKTGGFLGFLGRVNTLNPRLEMNLLEKIDIRQKTTFTLNTTMKKMEFITHHPAGSYEIKEVNPDSVLLTISNPEKFWELSKCLVIVM